jgi:hypothetical protein
MNEFLTAALRFAELGYGVFPCAPGRKQPMTARGFLDATTDTEQIEAWWSKHPKANVAIPTAGLVVIDVDGPDNAWLVDDPDRLSELTTGALTVTPRGGKHYIFRAPVGRNYRCQTGQLAPRVDVRADGGYILVPPSQVGGKVYRFVPGMELDQPREQLREPPEWLVAALDGTATSSPTSPRVAAGAPVANQIPSGQRNATLARLAGTMRRVGMSRSEISAALIQANLDRCSPPMSPAEVARIAESVSRYEPDQIATAITEDHWKQLFDEGQPSQLQFQAITSRELDENQYELTYLIDGILVRGQPGVIAGPKKTLKTNISIDLALSLSHEGLFLGQFNVTKSARVGVMSGESGAATIQETARRIADAKGQQLREFDSAFWSFQVPQLGDNLHTAALRRFIETYQLEVLILDPTYLMMLTLGDSAGNLFTVGSFLKSLGDLAQETGCTPILCHHLKKGIADPYEPAELENIAWAGFQEFVRQWILLNRRVRYDPDRGGHHELWMSVGGSAGHSGLWGVNIDEGTRQDANGRHWEVEVVSAAEAYSERAAGEEEATERRKQRQQDTKLQRQREAVLEALEQFPNGETSRVIREHAGVGARSIQAVLDGLVEEGKVVPCTVQKNTRQEPAYRLSKAGGPGGP